MKSSDKKLALLTVLQQFQDYIGLPDLMKKLGPDFAERTIRRWLNEMVVNGEVEKIGQKRGTRYRAKLKENKSSAISSHIALSNTARQALQIIKNLGV